MLARLRSLLRIRSLPGWAAVALAWDVLGQLHLATFAIELLEHMNTWVHAHPSILLLAGFCWLGALVLWPSIKSRLPKFPRTLHERVEHLETHRIPALVTVLEQYTEGQDRLHTATGSLNDTKFGAVTDRLKRLEDLELVYKMPAFMRCFRAIETAVGKMPSAIAFSIHVSHLADEVLAVIEDGWLTADKPSVGSLQHILERHRKHFDYFVRCWRLEGMDEIQRGELFVAVSSDHLAAVTPGRLIELVNAHYKTLCNLRDHAATEISKPISDTISSMDHA